VATKKVTLTLALISDDRKVRGFVQLISPVGTTHSGSSASHSQASNQPMLGNGEAKSNNNTESNVFSTSSDTRLYKKT
jgi:hypothetical protein